MRLRIFLARLALLWERIWPALWPPLGILGIFLIFTLSGVWRFMPLWSLDALKILFPLAFLAALWREIRALDFPSPEEGIRRLEIKSGLPHRPLSALLDELPAPPNSRGQDTVSRSLWKIYQQRLSDRLTRLRVGWPRSVLPVRDPHALRVLLGLGLVISIVAARPDIAGQFAWVVETSPHRSASVAVTVDTWITPPAYTGEPPIFLSRQDASKDLRSDITVPVGSVFMARVQGADAAPRIERETAHASPSFGAPARAGEKSAFKSVAAGVFEYTGPLDQDTKLSILNHGKIMGSWNFTVRPDEKPIIEFAGDVTSTKQLSVKIPYGVMDDYGVVKAYAGITLHQPSEPQDTVERSADGHAPSSPKEIRLDLTLPRLHTKSAEDVAYEDLTAHKWAGLKVDIQLHGLDQAGQMGQSKIVTFTLPERAFTHPLARALIEQRKNLARHPGTVFPVARMLEALTVAPEKYYPDMSVYLGLRTAYWKLMKIVQWDKGQAEIDEVSQMLWDIALSLEDGNVSLAARRLKELQQQLSDALADGKPQDEIDRIMKALRQALDDYLAALTAQGIQALRDNPQMGAPSGTPVTRQDWQNLLDSIEQMLRDGNLDGARAMLSQMMNMLQNLQLSFGAPGMSEGESAMNEALGNLGDMIGRQRGLLDETFRKGRPGAPGVSPGMPGEDGPPGEGTAPSQPPGGDLTQRQEDLRRKLSEALQSLSDQGIDVPSELDRAARAMGRARDALKDQDMGAALDPQKEAIDQLRQGAQEMAQDLLNKMAKRQGLKGGRETQDGTYDPLGRPSASSGPEYGDSVKIPGGRDRQRARDILRELRRRASETGRPAFELEYLERLLKRF